MQVVHVHDTTGSRQVLTDLLHRMNKTAFEEDAIILREQQKMMEIPGGEPLVNLAADKAVNEARRIVRRLFDEEAAAR